MACSVSFNGLVCTIQNVVVKNAGMFSPGLPLTLTQPEGSDESESRVSRVAAPRV